MDDGGKINTPSSDPERVDKFRRRGMSLKDGSDDDEDEDEEDEDEDEEDELGSPPAVELGLAEGESLLGESESSMCCMGGLP